MKGDSGAVGTMKSLRASSLVVAFITLSALFFQASGKKGKNSALPPE